MALALALLSAVSCTSKTIPVSGNVTDVRVAGDNEVSVTVEITNEGTETTDIRCSVRLVNEKGEKTSFTVLEPAVAPEDTRTFTTRGPGPSESEYLLGRSSIDCAAA